jgi:O-antigen/teichoic acid export membrane protein
VEFRRLLGAASVLFALRVLGALAQLVFLVYVAREFGIENFGVFSTALTLAVVSSMIGRWGADQWVLRELSATLVKERVRGFAPVLLNGLVLVLCASLLVGFFLFAASETVVAAFIGKDVPDAGRMIQIMAASIAPFALVNFFAEVLRTVDHHAFASILQTVLVPLLSLLLVMGLSFAKTSPLVMVAASYLLACVLAAAAGAIPIWRIYRQHAGGEPFVWFLGEMFGEASSIAMVVLLSTWLAYADVLLIGFFGGPSEVGLYTAAQRIVLLLSFLIISLNSMLGPRFSAMNQQADHEGVFALYEDSRRMVVKIVLPLAGLIALLSPWLLSVFGEAFRVAVPILLLLLLGRVINVMAGPVEVVMMMLRHVGAFKSYTMAAILLHLVLSVVLTSRFGAMGAAVSTCLATALISFLCWRFVNKLRSGEIASSQSRLLE